MTTSYPRIAGQSLDRLAALSDGIFAVAMTLLVLDLRVPVAEMIHPQHPLWTDGSFGSERGALHALAQIAPRLLPYVMSFLTLGIFWVGQQTQFNHFNRTDRHLTWIHLGFLFVVSLLPFSAALLAHYVHLRLAVGAYWLNILLLGVMLEWGARYGRKTFLSDDAQAAARLTTFRQRILIAQTLYALAALICFVNTQASVIALAIVQLYFIVSPRLPRVGRAQPPDAPVQ